VPVYLLEPGPGFWGKIALDKCFHPLGLLRLLRKPSRSQHASGGVLPPQHFIKSPKVLFLGRLIVADHSRMPLVHQLVRVSQQIEYPLRLPVAIQQNHRCYAIVA
jgi:hypothetical protein